MGSSAQEQNNQNLQSIEIIAILSITLFVSSNEFTVEKNQVLHYIEIIVLYFYCIKLHRKQFETFVFVIIELIIFALGKAIQLYFLSAQLSC